MGCMTKVDEALRWAAELHSGQVRDGAMALPYITHPVEVLIRLRWVGGILDEELLCVAVLHDTLEECDVDASEIERRFGSRVASLVKELTRYEPGPSETAGLTSDQIYELRSRTLLDEIANMSSEAMAVKLSDRLSNLEEAVRVRALKKLKRYVQQTDAILNAVPKSVNPDLWDAVSKANEKARKALKDGKD